jgi:hypothetical protein
MADYEAAPEGGIKEKGADAPAEQAAAADEAQKTGEGQDGAAAEDTGAENTDSEGSEAGEESSDEEKSEEGEEGAE